jgi:hypothetical protein
MLPAPGRGIICWSLVSIPRLNFSMICTDNKTILPSFQATGMIRKKLR